MDRLKQIIEQETGTPVTKLTPNFDLIQEGGLDSLDTMTVLMEIENTFEIDIDDKVYQNVRTYGDLEAMVQGLIDEKF